MEYLERSLLLVLDGGEELLVGEGSGGGGEGSSSCFLGGRRFGGLMSGLLLLTVVSWKRRSCVWRLSKAEVMACCLKETKPLFYLPKSSRNPFEFIRESRVK